MQTAQLQLRQVSLAASSGSRYLLKDISFEAWTGDRIAIVGPTGAGKTSLLRLLNRLNEPTAGFIRLEDQEYRQIPVIQLRQQITLVPQESKLLGMTVREALAYPLTLRRLPSAEIQQRLDYWTEQLRIPSDWLGRTEVQLSAGQRQWCAIARALVIQPKILLLDEPTSALDVGQASHLLQVLAQVENSPTVLMVNHQLELAQSFCTRVLHLQHGQLVQDVPKENMNWAELKTVMQAEAQEDDEWGLEDKA